MASTIRPTRIRQPRTPLLQWLGERDRQIGQVISHVFLVCLCVILLVPFYWLFSGSLKTITGFNAVPIQWIPEPIRWENYTEAWNSVKLGIYLFNSTWLGIAKVLVTLFSSSLVAYGFARFRFRFREPLFIVLIASMMLPWQATTIPVYIFFKWLGWVGSYAPLLVPDAFGAAYNIFLLRQFFLNLPATIDEAARLDGCNSFSTWWRIILPQAKPALVVVSLFTFLWSWKDLWGPLIYLSRQDQYTVPIGLLTFESPTVFQFTQQLAAVVICLVPTLLFYVFGQRYLDRGIAIADVK